MSITSKQLFIPASQIITDDPSSGGDVLSALDSGQGFGPVSVVDILNAAPFLFNASGNLLVKFTDGAKDCFEFMRNEPA